MDKSQRTLSLAKKTKQNHNISYRLRKLKFSDTFLEDGRQKNRAATIKKVPCLSHGCTFSILPKSSLPLAVYKHQYTAWHALLENEGVAGSHLVGKIYKMGDYSLLLNIIFAEGKTAGCFTSIVLLFYVVCLSMYGRRVLRTARTRANI